MFKRHFQQYFSYILAVSFIGGETGENHPPVAGHRQTRVSKRMSITDQKLGQVYIAYLVTRL